MVQRVLITLAAEDVVHQLRKYYGDLVFHQTARCRDNFSLICFQRRDFKLGNSDVYMGTIANCDFYTDQDQFAHWKYTQLVIDVINSRGSSLSLEIPLGLQFIPRSRVFTNVELLKLEQQGAIK